MPKKLFDLIGSVLGVDPSTISDNTAQKDIDSWDSLNSLLLIDEIEKEYNVKIPVEDVIEVNSVLDIKRILKKHNVDVGQT